MSPSSTSSTQSWAGVLCDLVHVPLACGPRLAGGYGGTVPGGSCPASRPSRSARWIAMFCPAGLLGTQLGAAGSLLPSLPIAQLAATAPRRASGRRGRDRLGQPLTGTRFPGAPSPEPPGLGLPAEGSAPDPRPEGLCPSSYSARALRAPLARALRAPPFANPPEDTPDPISRGTRPTASEPGNKSSSMSPGAASSGLKIHRHAAAGLAPKAITDFAPWIEANLAGAEGSGHSARHWRCRRC